MKPSSQTRVVIVGAGHAGGRAAINLRQKGYLGPVTLVGNEPYPPYERPPLSKDVLKGIARAESAYLQELDAWHASGIDLRLNSSVVAIDRNAKQVLLDSAGALPYDRLILATGARARPFPGVVAANAPVRTLRTLDDVVALRPSLRNGARIGVLGAGFIGLEVASAALQLGAHPVIFEVAPRPLTRLLPTEFATWLMQLAIDHGVEFRFDSRVERIDPNMIVLADGEQVRVDATVVGIGAIPNCELATDAGLLTADGAVVDALCRTTDPSIYAIGDVACRMATPSRRSSRIESWRKAEDEALKVAAVLCGEVPQADSVPWFWTDVFGHNIQLAGEPSNGLLSVLHGNPKTGPFIIFYLEDKVLRGAISVDCGRELRIAQKLIATGEAVNQATLPIPRTSRRPIAVAS